MTDLLRPALLAFALAAVPFASADEWERLFEGATLDDFYIDFIEETEPKEVFEIEDDGTLHIKGEDKPEGYIQTLDEYGEYELEFAWRWPDEPGDSGLLLHCSDARYVGVWPRSIEVDLDHEHAGDLWLRGEEATPEKEEQYSEKRSERDRRIRLKDDAEKEPDEWNEMRVVIKKDTIEVYVNDELVNKGSKLSADGGFIAFQANKANLDIRDFRIKER